MKVVLNICTLIFIAVLGKGFLDMHSAIEAGEPARSVFMGAMPMLFLCALVFALLTLMHHQLSKAEETESKNVESK